MDAQNPASDPLLSNTAKQAYKAILDIGPADINSIAGSMDNVSHNMLAAALAELTALGLVAKVRPNSDLLVAQNPEVAATRLQDDWLKEASRLSTLAVQCSTEMSVLIDHYHEMLRSAAPNIVEHLYGLTAINEFIDQSINNCRRRVLTAQPGGGRSPRVLETALTRALSVLAKGIEMRTLYQRTAQFSHPTQQYVTKVCAAGAKVRILDEFFERLIVIDDSIAIIPATADRQSAAVIRDSSVISFLADVFDRSWQRATEFRATHSSRASEDSVPAIQQAIERLLIEGLSDAVIARRLGISERTCQKHVSAIKTRHSASTRVQLGYRLALQGASQSDQIVS